jgi:hypothetical protein
MAVLGLSADVELRSSVRTCVGVTVTFDPATD